MKSYMLDTNTVSHLIKKHPTVIKHLHRTPVSSVCISAITEGELLFGLAKRPDAKTLHTAVKEFLRCVDVLPWDKTVTAHYGIVRAGMESRGKTLGALDLLIGTHASAKDMILVTDDKAFRHIPQLIIENWTLI